MRNVRVFYKKTGRMKFVSHLDMNRYVLRLVKLAELPIWFTEGFNPHAHITFALPLSLGFESEYEAVDMKIIDDDFSNEQVKDALNKSAAVGIEIIKVCEPKNKACDIAFASYKLIFDCEESKLNDFKQFLKSEEINVSKKTKKGKINIINIAPKIKDLSFTQSADEIVMNIILPAGGTENLNPMLLLTAFETATNTKLTPAAMVRTMLYTADMEMFQ